MLMPQVAPFVDAPSLPLLVPHPPTNSTINSPSPPPHPYRHSSPQPPPSSPPPPQQVVTRGSSDEDAVDEVRAPSLPLIRSSPCAPPRSMSPQLLYHNNNPQHPFTQPHHSVPPSSSLQGHTHSLPQLDSPLSPGLPGGGGSTLDDRSASHTMNCSMATGIWRSQTDEAIASPKLSITAGGGVGGGAAGALFYASPSSLSAPALAMTTTTTSTYSAAQPPTRKCEMEEQQQQQEEQRQLLMMGDSMMQMILGTGSTSSPMTRTSPESPMAATVCAPASPPSTTAQGERGGAAYRHRRSNGNPQPPSSEPQSAEPTVPVTTAPHSQSPPPLAALPAGSHAPPPQLSPRASPLTPATEPPQPQEVSARAMWVDAGSHGPQAESNLSSFPSANQLRQQQHALPPTAVLHRHSLGKEDDGVAWFTPKQDLTPTADRPQQQQQQATSDHIGSFPMNSGFNQPHPQEEEAAPLYRRGSNERAAAVVGISGGDDNNNIVTQSSDANLRSARTARYRSVDASMQTEDQPPQNVSSPTSSAAAATAPPVHRDSLSVGGLVEVSMLPSGAVALHLALPGQQGVTLYPSLADVTTHHQHPPLISGDPSQQQQQDGPLSSAATSSSALGNVNSRSGTPGANSSSKPLLTYGTLNLVPQGGSDIFDSNQFEGSQISPRQLFKQYNNGQMASAPPLFQNGTTLAVVAAIGAGSSLPLNNNGIQLTAPTPSAAASSSSSFPQGTGVGGAGAAGGASGQRPPMQQRTRPNLGVSNNGAGGGTSNHTGSTFGTFTSSVFSGSQFGISHGALPGGIVQHGSQQHISAAAIAAAQQAQSRQQLLNTIASVEATLREYRQRLHSGILQDHLLTSSNTLRAGLLEGSTIAQAGASIGGGDSRCLMDGSLFGGNAAAAAYLKSIPSLAGLQGGSSSINGSATTNAGMLHNTTMSSTTSSSSSTTSSTASHLRDDVLRQEFEQLSTASLVDYCCLAHRTLVFLADTLSPWFVQQFNATVASFSSHDSSLSPHQTSALMMQQQQQQNQHHPANFTAHGFPHGGSGFPHPQHNNASASSSPPSGLHHQRNSGVTFARSHATSVANSHPQQQQPLAAQVPSMSAFNNSMFGGSGGSGGQPNNTASTREPSQHHQQNSRMSQVHEGSFNFFGGQLTSSIELKEQSPQVAAAGNALTGASKRGGTGESPTASVTSRRFVAPSPSQLALTYADTATLGMTAGLASVASQMIEPVHMTNIAYTTTDDVGMKMLNNYIIMETLGQGACGKVKLAFSVDRGISVAVKAVRRPKNDRHRLGRAADAQFRSLLREIAIMKNLRHKNIVSLYEVIDDPEANKLYLVMQYVDNGPIARITQEGTCTPLHPYQLAVYARQVCAGLQYLHSKNMVHRDIKPENILVSSNDQAFLSDFGVSDMFAETGDDGDPQTRRGSAVSGYKGTPLFMAPEMYAMVKHRSSLSRGQLSELGSDENSFHSSHHVGVGGPSVPTGGGGGAAPSQTGPNLAMEGGDAASSTTSPPSAGSHHRPLLEEALDGFALDIWALGVTFYALLCGRLPFPTVEMIQQSEPSFEDPVFEGDWGALIQRMLRREVWKRPSIEVVRAAVKRLEKKLMKRPSATTSAAGGPGIGLAKSASPGGPQALFGGGGDKLMDDLSYALTPLVVPPSAMPSFVHHPGGGGGMHREMSIPSSASMMAGMMLGVGHNHNNNTNTTGGGGGSANGVSQLPFTLDSSTNGASARARQPTSYFAMTTSQNPLLESSSMQQAASSHDQRAAALLAGLWNHHQQHQQQHQQHAPPPTTNVHVPSSMPMASSQPHVSSAAEVQEGYEHDSRLPAPLYPAPTATVVGDSAPLVSFEGTGLTSPSDSDKGAAAMNHHHKNYASDDFGGGARHNSSSQPTSGEYLPSPMISSPRKHSAFHTTSSVEGVPGGAGGGGGLTYGHAASRGL